MGVSNVRHEMNSPKNLDNEEDKRYLKFYKVGVALFLFLSSSRNINAL